MRKYKCIRKLCSPCGATLFDVDRNRKGSDCSRISLPLVFNLAFFAPFSPNAVPARSSHPAYPRLWHALRTCGQNVHKLRYHGGALPVGISHSDGHVIFKLQMSVDRYIVAKNHALSRISKRMENWGKKRIFPRLWTSCAILNMQTGIDR